MLESALFRFAWRFCECWMKSGSCRIEFLEKLWRKYWTQGREDSGIRFWHPESVSLMSPAFVKLGSPCALSWWLRFGTVLTSCCNLFVSRFSGYWKELPSGGAWSVGSIGLLLWGVVWLLGNLRNIVHIPQMKLKISENLIIWKFQWRSQISLHLCFRNKMCDVSHCFCMCFFSFERPVMLKSSTLELKSFWVNKPCGSAAGNIMGSLKSPWRVEPWTYPRRNFAMSFRTILTSLPLGFQDFSTRFVFVCWSLAVRYFFFWHWKLFFFEIFCSTFLSVSQRQWPWHMPALSWVRRTKPAWGMFPICPLIPLSLTWMPSRLWEAWWFVCLLMYLVRTISWYLLIIGSPVTVLLIFRNLEIIWDVWTLRRVIQTIIKVVWLPRFLGRGVELQRIFAY